MKYKFTKLGGSFTLTLLFSFLITQSYAQCPTLFNTEATTNVACSGDQVTFTALLNPADAQNGNLSVELGSGNVLIPSLTGPNPSGLYTGSLTLENDGCYPVTNSYSIRLVCDDDGSTSAIQTEDITVYPTSVEEFVVIQGDDCSASVGLSEACTDADGVLHLGVETTEFTAEPGESGIWSINYSFIDKLGLNPCPGGALSGSIEYPYDCFDPCGNFAGEMGGSTFVCGNDGFIVAPIDNDAVVDAGSTQVFVIHDGTSAQIGSNVYAVAGPGDPIMNDGTIPTNVSLCFSSVVGDQLDASGIPQSDGCYDISDDCQIVIFLDPITVSATEICDPETGTYDLQVLLNGGGPEFFPGHTYDVTGAISGSVLAGDFNTFGTFNSGEDYSFEIADDGKGCSLTYEFSTICEIIPDCDAGVLGGNAFVCDGEFVVASSVGFEYADDSELIYVLHDGSSDAIGSNIYGTATDGVIASDGSAPTNVSLCITAVVGNDIGADGIPLDSGSGGCYDISNCFQVVFLDPIIVETTEICDFETGQYTVEVSITGGGPSFFAGHTYAVTGDLSGELEADATTVAGPFDSGYTYSFEITEDGKGCSLDEAITGTADCGVYDLALTKTVASPGPFAPGDDVLFTIAVINQGNTDANNVEVTDYIPAGMTLSSSDNNGWSVSGSTATTTIASIPAGNSAIINILLTVDASQGEGSIVNYAEISGDDGEDIDSNTDQDISNDAGGVPNSTSDNSTNGTKGGDDEDDHDPAQIEIVIPAVYDLALVKTVSSAGPFMPGDDVTFTIEVLNQGGVDANNVEVTDYIPAGLTLSSSDTNGWTVSGSNATATIASIAAGASATIDVILTIDAGQDAGSIVNYAEISGDDGDDADSNTDQDISNDAGGVPNSSTDNSTNGTKGGDDEDDHDPAQIDVTVPVIPDVYDLALIKTVSSPGPFMPGDDVTYTIEVINQGDVDANNIEVTDYIPAGMTLSSSDNNGWIVSGSNATATIASIAAGSSATIDIVLTIDAGQGAGSIVNYAEISGDDGDDVDSNTDQDAGNDAGGVPNSSTDDSTDGTKGGDDEDDHDPAQIDVTLPAVYDLALIKTVSSPGPFMPGDDVTYTIEVINQGDVDANNIEVTDYIPAGMTLSSSDNNGWIVSGSNATATIASIAAGSSATIDIVLTIDAGQGAGSIVNYAEISGDDGDDVDSNTDQDAGNDAGGVPNSSTDDSTDGTKGGDDEDDHDPAQIDVTLPAVYDLALIKTVSSPGPFMPGDDVTYTITVINQGDVDANNIEVTDYIPSGMTLSSSDNNGWIVSGSNATATIASIAAGSSATIDIVLTIDAGQGAGSVVNYAEISGDDGDDVDSNTDQDAGNDAGGVPNSSTDNSTDGTKGGTDEDDHDPAQIDITVPAIYDLALVKTVAYTGPFAPGSDVLFAIEVINQGDVDANNVQITDYIPAGLSLSTNDNNGWVVVSGSLATVNIINITAGSSFTVNIILTVDADQTAGPIVNYAEISGDDGDDIDSNTDQDVANDAGGVPDSATDNSTDGTKGGTDEDDHDPAQINIMLNLPMGCLDPCSENYDPTAEVNDGSCLPYDTACNTDCTLGNMEVWDVASCSCIISSVTVLGCLDVNACNYDSNANCADDSSCEYGNMACSDPCNPILGCTNPAACNYNPAACVDDGSCDLGNPSCSDPCNEVSGCTNPVACNYNPAACVDNGSCELGPSACADPCSPVSGCTNPSACNYDPAACIDNGSCNPGNPSCSDPCNPAPGCTNSAACNYNPDACIDDGSCELGDPTCESNPCNPTSGCTDAAACNYDANACIDDGSCNLNYGCTNPAACNYDSTANCEDDSCDLGNPECSNPCAVLPGCTDSTACNFDPLACVDDGSCVPCDVYDLALIKDISSTFTAANNDIYCPGDEVEFSIAVFNQGDIDAFNIEITDYIPVGMSLSDNPGNQGTSPANNTPWIVAADGTATTTVPFIEAGGGVVGVSIWLTIDEDFTGFSLLNFAEISNDDGNDIDSSADNISGNDAGGIPNTPADNNITGVQGGFDEDDHDGDIIYLCNQAEGYDLALSKEIASSTTEFCHGQDVEFSISVFNQGSLPASNIEVTDYIPAGFSLSPNDSNGWSTDGTVATNVVAFLAAGDLARLNIILRVDADHPGGESTNFAEISADDGDDIDSTPDSDSNNDLVGPIGSDADEDDHDQYTVTIKDDCPPVSDGFDLALTKMVAAGQTGPFIAGAPVIFTITVHNQGTVAATNVGIIDYAPSTLFLNDPNWTTDGSNGATTVIPGPIAPGSTASVDISFIVDPSLFHSKDIANYAEVEFASDENGNPAIDIDSTPDNQVGNDAGGAPNSPADDYIDGDGTGGQGDGVAATDEDDADPATITVIAQLCDAGVLPTEIYACSTGVVSVSSTDALVPNGYQYVYVLHDGTETVFGNVIDYNTTGIFDGTDYPTNTPLTIQALVGPPKPVPSDLPVLCDLSNATTLLFLDPIQIVNPQYVCDSFTESYTVSFSITGGLPGFDASATYNVSGDFSSSNATTDVIYTFGPISNTTFNIYVDDDAGCSESYSENVECVKLPITLLSYEGEVKEEGNLLKWVTGSEIDNDYFTLEVSNDGVNFETISTIKGAGTSQIANSYTFLHRTALAGYSYYRLHQTDFDGTTTQVEKIVELVRGESAFGIVSLLPLPVLDNLQLSFTSVGNTSTQFDVLDVIGHSLIEFEQTSSKAGINTMEIDVSELPTGVYFVRMKTGDTIVSKKFIKE